MKYGILAVSLKSKHLHPVSEQEIDRFEMEKKILQHPLVGGIFLSEQNYENKDQLTKFVKEIKEIARQVNKNIFVMTDHEGGYLQPFSLGFSSIPAAKNLGRMYEIEPESALKYSEKLGEIVASELKSCGIDIALGPVVDLDTGNAVISGLDRAFHSDPVIVTQIARAYIKGLMKKGMSATLKHFPGHGSDVGDSHIEAPIDNRMINEIMKMDLIPFQELIKEGAIGAVMPAHITYPQVDNKTAGNSKVWLKDILRDQLGFKGVIISDCLAMEGAGKEDLVKKIKAALEYVDIAMLCDQSPEDYLHLLNDLQNEKISQSIESLKRIDRWVGV